MMGISIVAACEALTRKYVTSLVSCTDENGKAYVCFKGKSPEDMGTEAFLSSTANIVSFAMKVALEHGLNEDDFWKGLHDSVEYEPNEQKESKQEGVVLTFPKMPR